MRIATWNVERLKHYKELDRMLTECRAINADILVLTETDERIHPDYPYCYSTPLLKEIKPDYYKETENRVSIYTKYKCVKEHPTYDKYTAICVELETEYGNLCIYGTIMGIFGNREASFKTDLEKQMEDIKRLSEAGYRLCVIGDYNLTFSDNYYYTTYGRDTVLKSFEDNHIYLMTGHKAECIDHIALHDDFMYYGELDPSTVAKSSQSRLKITSVDEWNYDKALSDHKGIVIDIQLMNKELTVVDQTAFFDRLGYERCSFGDVCYKGKDGFYYRVEHLPGFYVVEDAENEEYAKNHAFEDTDTFPDYLPQDELVWRIHEWLKQYAK
ncbi:MAG: endonuclease/exonuclease/phosphatase family protein [Oribacterium sp.]|nr:endonuclease/exonuclease/phosphatase family protein [Oribacterium sp.]